MADLDDFFAKKDRKKSKSKKPAPTEEVAKKSDDTTSKKPVETKVRTDVDNNAPIAEQVNKFLKQNQNLRIEYIRGQTICGPIMHFSTHFLWLCV